MKKRTSKTLKILKKMLASSKEEKSAGAKSDLATDAPLNDLVAVWPSEMQ